MFSESRVTFDFDFFGFVVSLVFDSFEFTSNIRSAFTSDFSAFALDFSAFTLNLHWISHSRFGDMAGNFEV